MPFISVTLMKYLFYELRFRRYHRIAPSLEAISLSDLCYTTSPLGYF